MQHPKVFNSSVLAAALSTSISSLYASTALAQLEEVVVTAQKREQQTQDVPISVASLADDNLEAIFSGGEDILALSSRVPGLYAESSNGRAAPRFYIRGIGNVDFDLAASQPVSVVFDNVVQENVVLKSFPVFDVESVEVIRGPQGTLFGRNTTAGVIKFDSRKPTETFEGYIKTTAGQLGTLNIESAVGGALIENTLSARVSLLSQNRDDWIDNSYSGENNAMGGHEELAGRVQLLYTPTDDFSALLNYHTRDLESTASVFRANVFTTGRNGLNSNYRRDRVNFNQGDNNPQEYNGDGLSLKMDYDFDGFTLTSITAHERADGFSLGDIDGGVGDSDDNNFGPGFIPFDAVTSDEADVEQFTQEFRIASHNTSSFQWQAGAFYFNSALDVKTNDGFFGSTSVSHDNTTWAVFGQGSYDFSDALTLSAGIRYTDDEKSLVVGEQNIDGFALQIGAASLQNYDPVNVADDQFSGEISLNYRVSETVSLYSRIANGFRAQSIQARDVAFEGSPSVADSETIESIEFGIKADLFDQLRLNAGLFYYEIDDIQLSAVGGANNGNSLLNANKGVGQGFDVDLEWAVNDHLLLTAGYGYADTEIKDADLTTAPCGSEQCTVRDPLDADGNALINGNPFQAVPESTFNFTARLSVPFASGELFAFTDYAEQGKTSLTLYDALELQTDGQFELGLRVGYVDIEHDYQISIFGRNITDEDNVKGQIDFNNNTAFVNDPRIWGAEFKINF